MPRTVCPLCFTGKRTMSKIRHYDKAKHRKWSEAVKKRANFECQECKKYGRRDENGLPPVAKIAHHIKPLEQYPELAYDLSNGEALCLKCHAKRHPEKGGKHW